MSVNPFDIKTVLLATPAQHVVLIHFLIAVFAVAVAFDYCAHWTNNRPLAAAVYFNLLLAAFSAPDVAPGFFPLLLAPQGEKLQRNFLNHPGFGSLTSLGIF